MTKFELSELQNIEQLFQLFAIVEWCEENFGPSKTNSRHQWIGGSWFINGTQSITFTHSRDALLYKLRWT